MGQDDQHKTKMISFLTRYLGLNPETHISPLAKKLIALSIVFGLILSTLAYIGANDPDIFIDYGIKFEPVNTDEEWRWPWISEDENKNI